jgi:hypothetical protein
MNGTLLRFAWVTILLVVPVVANGAQLTAETWHAWQAYLKAADASMAARLSSGSDKFMWVDEKPDRRLQCKQGKILTSPMADHGMQVVPNGLIHDWIGAAFIPNVTIEKFLNVVADYDHYKEIYRPTVVDSQLLGRDGMADRFSMQLSHKSTFGTIALNTQYKEQILPAGENDYYAISQSTSIRQIRNYGKPDQEELPPGQGDGFIWSLHSIARYQQRDGGVYVELEAIALTRDIPSSLRWLVKPLVTEMSRNSLLISLTQTRDALCTRKYTESAATTTWGASALR